MISPPLLKLILVLLVPLGWLLTSAVRVLAFTIYSPSHLHALEAHNLQFNWICSPFLPFSFLPHHLAFYHCYCAPVFTVPFLLTVSSTLNIFLVLLSSLNPYLKYFEFSIHYHIPECAPPHLASDYLCCCKYYSGTLNPTS